MPSEPICHMACSRHMQSVTRGARYEVTLAHWQAELLSEPVRLRSPSGEESVFYVARFCGTGFALHQIRKMMGMVLWVLRGMIPEFALSIALDSPFRVNAPLAPAEPLLLRRADYYDPRKCEYRLVVPPALHISIRQYAHEVIYPHVAELVATPRQYRNTTGPEQLPFDAFFEARVYSLPDPQQGWGLLEAEYARWRQLERKVDSCSSFRGPSAPIPTVLSATASSSASTQGESGGSGRDGERGGGAAAAAGFADGGDAVVGEVLLVPLLPSGFSTAACVHYRFVCVCVCVCAHCI